MFLFQEARFLKNKKQNKKHLCPFSLNYFLGFGEKDAPLLLHKVKMQYVHIRSPNSTFFCLGKFLKKLADDQCSSIPKEKKVSTKSNICTYKLSVWKWIDQNFDV